jgi:hypothetical protein
MTMSKRKNKPLKAQKANRVSGASVGSVGGAEIRVDIDGNRELIDPDEERYCVCGDLSYGEMICCQLEDKVSYTLASTDLIANTRQCDYGTWFHMECVGLVEMPGRTVKWYCPGDRKKHKKGESTNGLVGRGITK